jgi:hypothetical protein
MRRRYGSLRRFCPTTFSICSEASIRQIEERLSQNLANQIARFEPSIVERIDTDLDLHAKKKKLQRLVDAQFLAGQTPDLPKLQLQLRELKLDNVELETGRPRTEAYIVYLFLMLRGLNGGCKDQHARLLLQESILEQGLDDFQKCFIDSTAVEANTDRPTDSSILVKLIARVCTTGGNLHRLDLPDMNQIGLLEQQKELRHLSQQIHFLNGKARAEAKRRKLYFHLVRRVRRLRKRLPRDLESVRRKLEGRWRSATESASGGRRSPMPHR